MKVHILFRNAVEVVVDAEEFTVQRDVIHGGIKAMRWKSGAKAEASLMSISLEDVVCTWITEVRDSDEVTTDA